MKQILESKIKEIADLINAGLTKQEFIDGFKKMLEYLKELEKNLNFKIDEKTQKALDDLSELQETHRQIVEKIETENQSGLSNLKKWALEKIGQLFINSRIKEKMIEVEQKLVKFDDYKLPDASTIALEASKMAKDGLLPLIPIIDKLEEKLPQMGDLIANSLEALPENKKLEINAIKDLKKELDELRRLRTQTLGGGGGFSLSAMTQHFINDEIPEDSGDHLTFAIDYTPVSGTFKLYRSRARQNLTEDYTLSGQTLTLTSAFDAATESLYCDYIK